MPQQDLKAGRGGGQQALERAGLSLIDDNGGGSQQAGDGKLEHHGRGGLRHGQDILVLRFSGNAGCNRYLNRRVLPSGQRLGKGRIEGGRIFGHFRGDGGGADRTSQAVGGHQKLGLDRSGGSLGWVGVKAQFQGSALRTDWLYPDGITTAAASLLLPTNAARSVSVRPEVVVEADDGGSGRGAPGTAADGQRCPGPEADRQAAIGGLGWTRRKPTRREVVKAIGMMSRNMNVLRSRRICVRSLRVMSRISW